MRLTLRTLLAYRDRVLGPADSEDLHGRIQKSEAAGNLFRRIDTVAKQTPLLAPPAVGTGLGADPNSVAEYLDDVLPSSQIPEFERVSLVSDVQLAELAHCHEYLVSALTTKVDVPAAVHQTALRIGKATERGAVQQELQQRYRHLHRGAAQSQQVRVDAPHKAVPKAAQSATTADRGSVPVKVQAPMVASGGDTIKPAGLDLENSTLPHEVPDYLIGGQRRNWGIPVAIVGLLGLLAFIGWQALGPWNEVAKLFHQAPTEAPSVQRSTAAEEEQSRGEAATTPQTEASSTETSPSTAGDPASTTESDVADSATSSQEDEAGSTAQVPPQPDTSGDVPPEPVLNLVAEWQPATGTAVLIQQAAGTWELLGAQPLQADSKLLVPPATRTSLALRQGVQWKTCGPSLIEFASVAAEEPPRIMTRLCRAVVQGNAGGKLTLATPLGEYALELQQPSSHVSIEVVHRPVLIGSAVDRRAFQPALIIIVAEGSATISGLPADPDAKTTSLNVGEGWAVVGDAQARVFKLQTIPPWLSNEAQRPVDEAAAADLYQALSANADIATEQQLLQLAAHRRPETAALATQTLLLVGNWQPFAGGFLDNERMRAHWFDTLDLARQLLALDAAAADALAAALSDAYRPERARLLFQLVVGLSEDEINSAGVAPLITELESSQMANRVLAAYELRRLTGETFGYQPHAPNRASVQNWRRELATKRLQIEPPRDPVWERLASATVAP